MSCDTGLVGYVTFKLWRRRSLQTLVPLTPRNVSVIQSPDDWNKVLPQLLVSLEHFKASVAALDDCNFDEQYKNLPVVVFLPFTVISTYLYSFYSYHNVILKTTEHDIDPGTGIVFHNL